jgi:hypothetical protein
VGWVTHVGMLRMYRRTPRTSLRSHSTCHSLFRVVHSYKKSHLASSVSRDRVINAPCDPSAPRFLAAHPGSIFVAFFLGPLFRGSFRDFGSRATFFIVINIIIVTSYRHRIIQICYHHVMKSAKLANTRKMVKNDRF